MSAAVLAIIVATISGRSTRMCGNGRGSKEHHDTYEHGHLDDEQERELRLHNP